MTPSIVLTPPRGLGAIIAAFGNIQVAGGSIVGPPGWESQWMCKVTLPGIAHTVYMNRAIVEPTREALTKAIARRPDYAIRTFGCVAPRAKRVNGDLSTHSWGLAVDMNDVANPLAAAAGPVVAAGAPGRGRPDAWVQIFEAIGFTWGGRFRRPDPMHFQWCSGY